MPAQLKNIPFGTEVALASDLDIPVASSTTLGGIKVGDNLSITSSGVLSATGGDPTKLIDASGNTVLDASCGTICGGDDTQYIPFSCGIEVPELKVDYDIVFYNGSMFCGDNEGNIVFYTCGGLIVCGCGCGCGINADTGNFNNVYTNYTVYANGLQVGFCGSSGSNVEAWGCGTFHDGVCTDGNVEASGTVFCYCGLSVYAPADSSGSTFTGPISFYCGALDFCGSSIKYCGQDVSTEFVEVSWCGTSYYVVGFRNPYQ